MHMTQSKYAGESVWLGSQSKYVDSAGAKQYQPWMNLLPAPENSHLPITSFSDEELLACQDPEAIREAQSIRRMLSSACEVTLASVPSRQL